MSIQHCGNCEESMVAGVDVVVVQNGVEFALKFSNVMKLDLETY